MAWFRSYLSDRSHFVCIRGVGSATRVRSLSCGVPQGSVLGPILYILYISPLGDIVRRYNMGFHFFADDTQLYLSFNALSADDQASSVSWFESCVRETDNWVTRNKLGYVEKKLNCLS